MVQNTKFCLSSQPEDISLDPDCRKNGLIIPKFFSGSGWNLKGFNLPCSRVSRDPWLFSSKLYHNVYTDPGFGYLIYVESFYGSVETLGQFSCNSKVYRERGFGYLIL
jgi:hypothetical protein